MIIIVSRELIIVKFSTLLDYLIFALYCALWDQNNKNKQKTKQLQSKNSPIFDLLKGKQKHSKSRAQQGDEMKVWTGLVQPGS